jgi:predicted component of type VI protein secretion system
MKLWLTVLCVVSLTGCSSSSADKQSKPAPSVPTRTTASNKSNPLAKYIELVGVRVNEKSPGHLQVQFGVVNHSEADIGDVKLDVSLGTTAAKPGEPPLITFSTKVPALGPNEMKQVSVDVPTKLRVYELPDWQFLKADFQIGDLR